MRGGRKLFCPIHKEQQIYQLRYTFVTKDSGKRKGTTFGTPWYYCKECEKPFKIEIKITKIEEVNSE